VKIRVTRGNGQNSFTGDREHDKCAGAPFCPLDGTHERVANDGLANSPDDLLDSRTRTRSYHRLF